MVRVSSEAFENVERPPRDFVVTLWSLLHGLYELYSAGLLSIGNDKAFVDYALAISARVHPVSGQPSAG